MKENSRGGGDTPDGGTMAGSVVAGVVAYCLTKGLTMEDVLEVTGLTMADILDPDVRLPDVHVPALWTRLQGAHPGEVVTLGMAEAVSPSFFGPLAYGVRHARDISECLDVFIRYQSILSSDLRMARLPGASTTRLRVSHPTDALDGGLGVEAGLAMGKRFMDDVLEGTNPVLRVEFAHQPFGPLGDYEAFFKTEVRFGCEGNGLLLPNAHLTRRPKEQDPLRFRTIQDHLDLVKERLMGGAAPKESPLGRLRRAIADNGERGEYGAEAAAKAVGMSLRSCQRLAKQEGTTLRALLEAMREANARQLLGDDSLTIDSVAFLLGYSSEGAFRRAFHRWTGLSPTQVRRGEG